MFGVHDINSIVALLLIMNLNLSILSLSILFTFIHFANSNPLDDELISTDVDGIGDLESSEFFNGDYESDAKLFAEFSNACASDHMDATGKRRLRRGSRQCKPKRPGQNQQTPKPARKPEFKYPPPPYGTDNEDLCLPDLFGFSRVLVCDSGNPLDNQYSSVSLQTTLRHCTICTWSKPDFKQCVTDGIDNAMLGCFSPNHIWCCGRLDPDLAPKVIIINVFFPLSLGFILCS